MRNCCHAGRRRVMTGQANQPRDVTHTAVELWHHEARGPSKFENDEEGGGEGRGAACVREGEDLIEPMGWCGHSVVGVNDDYWFSLSSIMFIYLLIVLHTAVP